MPTDKDGNPFPKEIWTDKRPFSWAVRWFGVDGNRYSRSFPTRTKAERFAEKKQADVRQGKADPPPNISLRDFLKDHQAVMKDNVARTTLKMQVAATELLAESVGWQCPLRQIAVRDIERFRAERLKAGIVPATANKEIHVVQKLAGHSDIKTTQKYYLSIQAEDFAKARNAQEALLPDLNATPTDPKMTHKGQKRSFPGRKTFKKGKETH